MTASDRPGGQGRVTPAFARPRAVLLVFLGGTLGTASREVLSLALPDAGGFPLLLFLVNVAGAFLLGLLLESLLLSGPDEGRRRSARLFLGTGALGGFTTYSSFAHGVAALARDGAGGVALFYALGSIVAGVLACLAGVALAAQRRTRGVPG